MCLNLPTSVATLIIIIVTIASTKSQNNSNLNTDEKLQNEFIFKTAQSLFIPYYKSEYKKIWNALNNFKNETSDKFDKNQCFHQLFYLIDMLQNGELWAIKGKFNLWYNEIFNYVYFKYKKSL